MWTESKERVKRQVLLETEARAAVGVCEEKARALSWSINGLPPLLVAACLCHTLCKAQSRGRENLDDLAL